VSNRPSQITQTVRAGLECDESTGAVVPPLHLTSTFAFKCFGEKRSYDYTRSGNPTRDLLGSAIAELEGGVGGVVTATGMAAITLVGYLIPAGGRIIAPHDCYGGTYRLFEAWRKRGERQVEFIEADQPAVDRDAEQSASANHRYREVRSLGSRRRRHRRCRQHVPVARLAATAVTGRRSCAPFHDEVPERSQRRSRRRGRCEGQGAS
jgi:cystathionine beta-lyase/cystathionine gamma-synthase